MGYLHELIHKCYFKKYTALNYAMLYMNELD